MSSVSKDTPLVGTKVVVVLRYSKAEVKPATAAKDPIMLENFIFFLVKGVNMGQQ